MTLSKNNVNVNSEKDLTDAHVLFTEQLIFIAEIIIQFGVSFKSV